MKKFLFVLLLMFFLIVSGCGNPTGQYREDILKASDDIISNSAEVEEILDDYSHMWRFTIESRGAIPVEDMMDAMRFDRNTIEKHFTINAAGNIPDDFSINLYSLKSYYEDIGKMDRISKEANEIKDNVSGLNNPPDEYDKVFEELLDLYDLSEEYLEMALNPSGSLQTFNEDKNRISSDILSKYKRIEVIIPNEQ